MFFQLLIAITAIVLTIVLLRKDCNIGIIMAINCLFIAIALKMPLDRAANALLKGISSQNTIRMILILILIMMLENIMRTSGMIKQMVSGLKGTIHNKKLIVLILPAVLGLLPSPGGARFSCPMVEEVAGNELSKESKTFLNYWYRHIWMDGFILYPSMVLVSQLVNMPVLKIFSCLTIFILLRILIGLSFIRWEIKNEKSDRPDGSKREIKDLIEGIFPIVFVVCSYIVLLQFTKHALDIACVITVIFLMVYKKYDFSRIKKTVREAFNFKYIIIILGVMIFNEFLAASGMVDSLLETISIYRVPKEIFIILLPFIGGFLSGVSISFVSLTFPILLPLGMSGNIWYVILGLVSGFAGVMVTPLHLCCVMTCDYFDVQLKRTLKKTVMAEGIVMLAAVTLIMLIQRFI